MSKIPESPPSLDVFIDSLRGTEEPGALLDTFEKLNNPLVGPVDPKGRYLHWEKAKYIEPPEGYTPALYWQAMKASRKALRKTLPFFDNGGKCFSCCIPDPVLARVLWITEQASGTLMGDPVLTDDKSKRQHLITSLTDEAIASSQLEGASTTRAVARDMIRSEREPTNLSERMIVNNYFAMRFIREHVEDDITPAMVFALHKILVSGTDIPNDRIGVFREDADNIVIEDHMTGELLHAPPPADELNLRLRGLCDFINHPGGPGGHTPAHQTYLPPVLRAIIAHFIMGYDHSFYDGNGRVARALFYWVMAREGFWLMEHLSISGEIKRNREAYSKAYLHVETDEGDVTYFLVHQLDIIVRAIERLKAQLRKQSSALRKTEELLSGSRLAGKLNHRQLSLLQHALKNPGFGYTVKSHQNSHRVARQTARSDLTELAKDFDLLTLGLQGRTAVFTVPSDLSRRIQRRAGRRRR